MRLASLDQVSSASPGYDAVERDMVGLSSSGLGPGFRRGSKIGQKCCLITKCLMGFQQEQSAVACYLEDFDLKPQTENLRLDSRNPRKCRYMVVL